MQVQTASEYAIRSHFTANNEASTLLNYRFVISENELTGDDEVTIIDDIAYPTGVSALAEMLDRGESWQTIEFFALLMLGEIWKE